MLDDRQCRPHVATAQHGALEVHVLAVQVAHEVQRPREDGVCPAGCFDAATWHRDDELVRVHAHTHGLTGFVVLAHNGIEQHVVDGLLWWEVECDDRVFRGGGRCHRHGQVLLEEQAQRFLHLTTNAAAHLVAQQCVIVLGYEFQLHRRSGDDAFGVVVQEHDGGVRYAVAPRAT